MFSDMNKAKNNIIRKKEEMKLRFFFLNLFTSIFTVVTTLDSVVQKLISSNQWLNFNPFFFFCLKAFYKMIFSILVRASRYQINLKKNKTKFAF